MEEDVRIARLRLNFHTNEQSLRDIIFILDEGDIFVPKEHGYSFKKLNGNLVGKQEDIDQIEVSMVFNE